MRGRALAFWFAVFAFALACAVTSAVSLGSSREGENGGGTLGALALFVAIAAASGFVLFRNTIGGPYRQLVAQRRATALDHQQRILQVAEKAGGRVSLAEIAAHADLPIPEVEAALAAMERDGLATTGVSAQGAVVYYFPGLAPATPAVDDV